MALPASQIWQVRFRPRSRWFDDQDYGELSPRVAIRFNCDWESQVGP